MIIQAVVVSFNLSIRIPESNELHISFLDYFTCKPQKTKRLSSGFRCKISLANDKEALIHPVILANCVAGIDSRLRFSYINKAYIVTTANGKPIACYDYSSYALQIPPQEKRIKKNTIQNTPSLLAVFCCTVKG